MFKNPFSFQGRIRRTEFGLSFLIYVLVYFMILASADNRSETSLGFLLFIPLLWFIYAQGVKRCHDLSRSGWWIIIPFYVLWLIFQAGDMWPNQYGYNPKFPEPNEQDNYKQGFDEFKDPQ